MIDTSFKKFMKQLILYVQSCFVKYKNLVQFTTNMFIIMYFCILPWTMNLSHDPNMDELPFFCPRCIAKRCFIVTLYSNLLSKVCMRKCNTKTYSKVL